IGLALEACDSTRPLPPAVFVEPAKLTIEDGQTATLTPRLRNPKARTVTWFSSNSEIATVNAAGDVTGVTNGTASIVVRMTDDTTISTTVPVTVSGPAVAEVIVNPPAPIVFVGFGRRLFVQLLSATGITLHGRTV